MQIRFTSDYDAVMIDPYCQCKKIVAYKSGWSGNVGEVIARAAIAEKKAEEIGDVSDNESDTPSIDLPPKKRIRRNRPSSSG